MSLNKQPKVKDSEYIKIWNFEKNDKEGITPDITLGSAKKVWWLCKEGHEFQQMVHKKVRSGVDVCSVCTGQVIVAGINDMESEFPEISKAWDYEKNAKKPSEIAAGSETKRWWICDKGHSFEQTPYARTRSGHNCPYCAGRKALRGFNDLETVFPEIAKLWDYSRNGKKTPQNVPHGHDTKVWWICDKGHSHQQTVYEKTGKIKKGCPICAGKKTEKGFNDLATTRPEYLEYWSFEKNKDISPYELTASSNKTVWWKCKVGHDFERSPNAMSKSSGAKIVECPYCSNKVALKGFNDLESLNPELAKRWDYSKNKKLPSEVIPGSHEVCWWTCENSHSNSSIVRHTRVLCKTCHPVKNGTSIGEKELRNYIKSLLPPEVEIKSNCRDLISPYEVDIYIPDLKVAFEFNGIYWHGEDKGKDKKYHYSKWEKCKSQNVQLITVWEDNWRDKQEIVKSMIAHKLGLSKDEKVFAKDTYVDSGVEYKEAKDFAEKYHIQGATYGSYYIGLRDRESKELVAISIWRKVGHEIFLDRYCTSLIVVGGTGKLISYAKSLLKNTEVNSIVSFSDNEISNGGLYKKLGFKKDQDVRPDYKYVYKSSRVHKFNFRKQRFKKNPELLYQEGLTELELAFMNNLVRIWDSGKVRWTLAI